MRVIIVIEVVTAGPQPYWRTRMTGTRADDSVHWSKGHNDKVCSFTGVCMKVECTTRVWISFEWNICGTLSGLIYINKFSSNLGYKEVAFGPWNIQGCVNVVLSMMLWNGWVRGSRCGPYLANPLPIPSLNPTSHRLLPPECTSVSLLQTAEHLLRSQKISDTCSDSRRKDIYMYLHSDTRSCLTHSDVK